MIQCRQLRGYRCKYCQEWQSYQKHHHNRETPIVKVKEYVYKDIKFVCRTILASGAIPLKSGKSADLFVAYGEMFPAREAET